MNESFIFYESWAEYIDALDIETAKEVLYQIYLVGLGRETTTDNPIIKGVINGLIVPNLNSAKSRYKASVINGKKGGRPPKELDETLMLKLHNDGLTYEQIGKELGVSKGTIADRMKKLKTKNQNQKPITETDRNLYIDKDNYIDNEKENDSDNNYFTF